MGQAGISLEADLGNGFQRIAVLQEEECRGKLISLPRGTVNIRLIFEHGNRILNLTSVEACAAPAEGEGEDLWYDLSFSTDGYRLGHNLFLLEHDGSYVEGQDFRYLTYCLKLTCEEIPLSAESTQKLGKSTRRLQTDLSVLEEKWQYQIQVYDEKVREVEALERDKVELNTAIEELRNEREFWRGRYLEMEGSSSWKLTAPLRQASGALKDYKRRSFLSQLKKDFAEREKAVGTKTAARELFASWSVFPAEAPEEAAEGPVFSVHTAFCDEDRETIQRFFGTLMSQTYPNFRVFVKDAYDGEHKTEHLFLQWLAAIDGRIRFTSEEDPESFTAVLDPTDFLKPHALSICAEALRANPLARCVYTDSDFYTQEVQDAADPWFKPDYAPDYLLGMNYIRGFFAAKGAKLPEEDGQKHYAFILNALMPCEEAEVCHVTEKLFFEKKQELPGVAVERAHEIAAAAIKTAAEHFGPVDAVDPLNKNAGLYHVQYRISEQPLISVVIPNKDHVEDLNRCIESILRTGGYPNLEIIVCENNSAKKETFDYYRKLEAEHKARIVQWKHGFNFSDINNFAVKEAKGAYLLLLNNDIYVRSEHWILEMLMYAQRADVGAVGAKLLYPDDTVQHAGVIIGLGGVAAHSHKDYAADAPGYMNRLLVAQELSAVTAACLLMHREVYEEIGGMNPGYEVAFNDADFCMRIRQKGYRIVWTPFAVLTHDESKSRGVEDTPEKAERFESEVQRFKRDWPEILRTGDPYYNPNLTTAKEDFSVKPEAL